MNFETFWYESEHFPLNSGASEDDLKVLEAALGLSLPASYKKLLCISNGGVPNYSGVKLPRTSKCGWSKAIFIDGLYGTADLGRNSYILDTWEMTKDLLLISGNCHHNIALRFAAQGEPTVVYYESDSGDMIQLAKNFDEFLVLLEPED